MRKKLNSAAGYSCLNFASVYIKIPEARKQLVGDDLKDKVFILKTIIQGNFVRRSTHNSHQRTVLTNLYALHRATLFMGEKQAYWDRVDEAVRNHYQYFCINTTDGMDQVKTALPVHVGDDVLKVTQHLQGR